MGVTTFFAAVMAFSAVVVAQAPGSCAIGNQVCGTACCDGPASAFNCLNGACIPASPGMTYTPGPPAVVTSSVAVTGITLITTSPSDPLATPPSTIMVTEPVANTTVPVPLVSSSLTVTMVSEPAANTTVSVPLVSGSLATIVSSVNLTSWSTTAFPTGEETTSSPTHSMTKDATHTAKPDPTGGANGFFVPGTGVLGVAVAAALGAL